MLEPIEEILTPLNVLLLLVELARFRKSCNVDVDDVSIVGGMAKMSLTLGRKVTRASPLSRNKKIALNVIDRNGM